MPPRLSILLPAYNAAPYLSEAVGSILRQTFTDFELLLINDGSTDATGVLINQLAAQDARIRPIHQPNQRIVATLNGGLSLALEANAPFIAIMHADDVALPTRLEKQLVYLRAHPEIDLCGTWIQTFGGGGGEAPKLGRVWQYPTDPEFIPCFLLFWCCLAHPTMMFRRSLFDDPALRYNPAFNHAAEDYALWAAASAQHKIGNVAEILLHYREHPGQGSQLFKPQQRAETRAIRRGLLTRLGLVPTEAQMDLHQRLSESEFQTTPEFISAADCWLNLIGTANLRSRILPQLPLSKVLAARWAAVCLHAGAPHIWRQFWQSPLAPLVDRSQPKNHAIPDP